MFTVKILPNDKGNPPGKLADVELHFTDVEQDCPMCQGQPGPFTDVIHARNEFAFDLRYGTSTFRVSDAAQ